MFDFIEGWYDPHRRQSAIEYQSPLNYEKRRRKAAAGPSHWFTVHGTGGTPLDEADFHNVTPIASTFGTVTQAYAAPRTYGAELSWRG